MAIDVTVVVPVYNTGKYIEPCIEGVLDQSLPRDRYEVIFIDDGSTDATPERLDRLGAEHPDLITVVHQPNSGWPGKPRNVGTDMARGEFVFYLDHDDRLLPEALERMVAMARRTKADVLIPKMIGDGLGAPIRIVRTNIDRAVIGRDPITKSLTPHKLFRRDFIVEKGMRWVEGRIRLEDEMFLMEAYLRADVISVLGDYACYIRYGRDDGGNAAYSTWAVASEYFTYVERVIDIIEAHSEPGPIRDAMLLREYDNKMLMKISGRRLLSRSDEEQRDTLGEVRRLATERFPPDFPKLLPPVKRAVARAMLANDIDQLRALAKIPKRTGLHAELRNLRWTGESWSFDVEASFCHNDGSPITVTPRGDQWALDRRLVPRGLKLDTFTREEILTASLDVTVREETQRVIWFADSQIEPALVAVEGDRKGAHQLIFRGTATLDPTSMAGGRPLQPGKWRLSAHGIAFGLAGGMRLMPSDDQPRFEPQVGGFLDDTFTAQLALDTNRRLRLTVQPRGTALASVVQGVRTGSLDSSGTLTAALDLRLAPSADPWDVAVIVLGRRNGRIARYHGAITADSAAQSATLTVPGWSDGKLPRGVWRVGFKLHDRRVAVLGSVNVRRWGRVKGFRVKPGSTVKIRRPRATAEGQVGS